MSAWEAAHFILTVVLAMYYGHRVGRRVGREEAAKDKSVAFTDEDHWIVVWRDVPADRVIEITAGE